MQSLNRDFSKLSRSVTPIELSIVLISVTLITGSSLDALLPTVSRLFRIIAYGSILFFGGLHILRIARRPFEGMKALYRRYRFLLVAVAIYFLGLIIGGLHGPDPLHSFWQTFSDAMVFSYALILFGFVDQDPNETAIDILRISAIWIGLLLTGSALIYLGNTFGWWLINPYYHTDSNQAFVLLNGPFNHANHFAYVLMIGAFASTYFAILHEDKIQWKWVGLTVFLCIGLLLTFGRGSMLGAAVGILILVTYRYPKLGALLGFGALVVIAYLVAGAIGFVHVPEFIPKVSFASRGELWDAAISNLRIYGPLGVGSGQADSLAGMGIHNFMLEQYGEGGILTVLGVLGWLVIPLTTLKRSLLSTPLKTTIIAVMAGIMVHGLFWNQFLNGVRFLSLIGVLLWTALATTKEVDRTSGLEGRLPT